MKSKPGTKGGAFAPPFRLCLPDDFQGRLILMLSLRRFTAEVNSALVRGQRCPRPGRFAEKRILSVKRLKRYMPRDQHIQRNQGQEKQAQHGHQLFLAFHQGLFVLMAAVKEENDAGRVKQHCRP